MSYDKFIEQVKDRAAVATIADSITACRAVLETLGQLLPLKVVNDFLRELPAEIGYSLQEGSEMSSSFGLREFYRLVSERDQVELSDAVYHARAVLSVLSDVLTVDHIKRILKVLPKEFAPLFRQGAYLHKAA